MRKLTIAAVAAVMAGPAMTAATAAMIVFLMSGSFDAPPHSRPRL